MFKYVVEKVGNCQKLCNYANSQLGGGGTHRQGRYRNQMFNFLGDLQNAYVVVKYELWSSMLWKKLVVVKDFVKFCAKSQFGGVHTDRGKYGKGMLNLCERPSQCLCCGKLWKSGQVCCGKSWQWSKTL